MLAVGEARDASALLLEAIAYAESVTGVDEQVRAFLEVFQAAVAAKAQNHAEKCERQLLAISRQGSIIAYRAGVLGTLIDGLIRLGLEARARGLADIDLSKAVAAAGTLRDKSATLRVLSKSRWRLKDF
jgi:hypothetical protein